MARQFHDEFEELYCISDLHLGDAASRDGQAVGLLERLIETLRARAEERGQGKTGLVLNGDIVDFLDLRGAQAFDPVGAPYKLSDVIDANPGFWRGLDDFSKVGTVILTLGNHDVELALPTCCALLRRTITGSLLLAFDGAGYRCVVGGTHALFIHGNNEDPWNFVDFHLLARIRAASNAGRAPEPWVANEGTKLVIEVLNERVKRSLPILEYLKPEGPWIIQLVDRLGQQSRLAQLAELLPRKVAASLRYAAHQRSDQSVFLDERRPESPATMFDAEALLVHAHRGWRREDSVPEGYLGRPASDEVIREVLSAGLHGGRCFALGAKDDIYPALHAKIGAEIHWVLCGHTHLRRSVADGPIRHYFNSGTWMRLLDLEQALDDDFAGVKRAFEAKTRDELDACTWGTPPRPIVRHQPTLVVLQAVGGGARGWLADPEVDIDQPLVGQDEQGNKYSACREIKP